MIAQIAMYVVIGLAIVITARLVWKAFAARNLTATSQLRRAVGDEVVPSDVRVGLIT